MKLSPSIPLIPREVIARLKRVPQLSRWRLPGLRRAAAERAIPSPLDSSSHVLHR